MEMLYLLIAFVIGGVVGGAIMELWRRANSQGGDEALRIELAKLQSEKEAQADKEEWIKNAEEKLREAFDSLAGKSLRHNADAFLKQAQTQMTGVLNEVRGDWKTQKSEMQNLMTPVRENLDKLDGHVRSLEEKREGAYRALDQQLKELVDAQQELQTTTVTLSQALKSSSVRGQWGEIQLRRVVELVGMEQYMAFEEQVSGDSGRPDMVVYLPGGGELPVDAKTPMTAYLNAAEAGDDATFGKPFCVYCRANVGKQHRDQQTKQPSCVLPCIDPNIAQFLFDVAEPLIDLRLDSFKRSNAGFNGWHLYDESPFACGVVVTVSKYSCMSGYDQGFVYIGELDTNARDRREPSNTI